MAQRIGIPKTTVARAVNALVGAGYVARHPSGRTYYADYGVLTLAGDLLQRLTLRQRAAPHLHRLAARAGVTCYLGVLWRGQAVVLDRATPVLLHDHSLDIGKHNPLHVSAMARAILAFLPAEQREAAIAACDVAPLSPSTITDRDAFRRELERTRERAYARTEQDQGRGRRSVAAPIFDARGQPVGALASANWDPEQTPLERLSQIIQETQEAAQAVSYTLGYGGAPVLPPAASAR